MPLAHVAGVPVEETIASFAPMLGIAFALTLARLRSPRAAKRGPRWTSGCAAAPRGALRRRNVDRPSASRLQHVRDTVAAAAQLHDDQRYGGVCATATGVATEHVSATAQASYPHCILIPFPPDGGELGSRAPRLLRRAGARRAAGARPHLLGP